MSGLLANHEERMYRAKLSLAGLSVGDAFGEMFFSMPDKVDWVIRSRSVPSPTWHYTDDTEMAISVVRVLEEHGTIQQDELAKRFVDRYWQNPGRGYGGTAHGILQAIGKRTPWQIAASSAFGGMGSMGNGGAMRVAPLGAYFADDVSRAIDEARKSAEVTHAHPEGQAGAIAVAVAAAFAWNEREKVSDQSGTRLIECVLDHTPVGETRQGIEKAYGLARDLSVETAIGHLGNGSRVISQDTVPFCLWCAARHLNDYVGAMWTTVSGLGDRDTNCAIVGGIVVLAAGERSIPSEWLCARERLVF
ncbi:MAG TPA: ADP-ribosylglycohydrolase family protein [Planctomycetota bacterium]|nr:ADP-ribosylglycohydrolase family protein [Planctomycetota bacterium]